MAVGARALVEHLSARRAAGTSAARSRGTSSRRPSIVRPTSVP
jgi:hypothetical protein